MFKPMLAQLGSIKDLRRAGWIYEPKLDGTRAICFKDSKTRFLNRRGHWFGSRYPEIVAEIPGAVKARSAMLDGEIVVLNKSGIPDFYKLQVRERQESKLRIEILSRAMPATYFVFDIIALNGKSLINKPLVQRKKILENTLNQTDHVKLVYYTRHGTALWRAVKKLALEGVMAKRLSSLYEPGTRSSNWLKIKRIKSLDVLICGWTEGERAGLGALLCGVWHKAKLIYVGRVGTGFTEESAQELLKILKRIERKKSPFDIFKEEREVLQKVHWCSPKYVAEVHFMNLSKDLKMRAPSFKYLRFDKPPEECTLSERDLKAFLK